MIVILAIVTNENYATCPNIFYFIDDFKIIKKNIKIQLRNINLKNERTHILNLKTKYL